MKSYYFMFFAAFLVKIMLFDAQKAYPTMGGTDHAEISETRKKVVMVDTGISFKQLASSALCKDTKNLGDLVSFNQYKNHGVNVFGLIEEGLDSSKYCIYPILWYPGRLNNSLYKSALQKIDQLDHVVGVNLSLNGEHKLESEQKFYQKWVDKGIKVHVAAGNQGVRVVNDQDCIYYPACFKDKLKSNNFVVVGSDTGNYSNSYDHFEVVLVDGTNKGTPSSTGTSMSTAIYTGRIFSK